MRHICDEKFEMTNTCVAFGRFDGLHTGHMAVVRSLLDTARARGLAPVLVSFARDGAGQAPILTAEKEKAFLLAEAPPKALVSLPGGGAVGDFYRRVLVGQLGARAVVAGGNHRDLAQLRKAGGALGFDVIECEVMKDEGLPVSAARITDALKACQLDMAARLLGRPYTVMGQVVPGKQLGRTVGQPTANINFTRNKQLPPDGSYVTVTLVDGVRRVGLTNIGRRPTVDSFDYTTMENHILDFSGDLYGKELVLEFHRFIRGVEKFDSLAEVKAQVAKDIQAIHDYIASVG